MQGTDTSRWRYDGTTGFDTRGNRVQMPTAASYNAEKAWAEEQSRKSRASHNRLVNFGRVASMAPLAFAAAPAMAGVAGSGVGGAAGSAAGSAIAGTAAPTITAAGGAFTYGNLLKAAEIGIPAITGVIGQRSQNRALDRQSRLEQQSLAEQMAYAREMEAQRRAEAERMFAEDQRRWEAEERNRARELAATEEERAYRRRLDEERETRRAPYRQAGRDALFRLQDIIGMGRR